MTGENSAVSSAEEEAGNLAEKMEIWMDTMKVGLKDEWKVGQRAA